MLLAQLAWYEWLIIAALTMGFSFVMHVLLISKPQSEQHGAANAVLTIGMIIGIISLLIATFKALVQLIT